MKKSETPTFFYEKFGNGKNKIIFIHGFGASRKSFYDLLPFFDETYEIYLLDLIGFGNSKFVRNWDYTFQNQVDLLYDFLKEKKLEDITLAGHSYGGGVVLLLLLLAQKLKDNTTVKNVILLGPGCYSQKIPFFIRFPATSCLYKVFMFFVPKKLMAKYILNKLYYDKTKITKEKILKYSDYFRKWDNINAIVQTSKNIIPENVDELEATMKTIKTTALIVWGDKDFVVPGRNITRLSKELKNSVFIKIKNSGHMIQEEQPEETFSAIDHFIKNTKPQQK